ncbi:FecCD family ABC transporter permease [Psychrobacter pygoscelis]|uniref:FecCD family ABC transporter permease n=1 Tax=Psychrobacter pygoscelis TaxID=2488563 RepID=UPI00103B0E14|nr:iron ABC transporter permease [Psychrobacter pygoscelis]
MTQQLGKIGKHSVETNYFHISRRRSLICLSLLTLLIFAVIADIAIGPARYNLLEVTYAILQPQDVDKQLKVIVWNIRMPSTMMGICCGMALAVAGLQMQTILNNPLASPFTLGISAGASFGAALALAFGLTFLPGAGPYFVALNAFVGAIATALIIFIVSMRRDGTVQTIILLGIALVFTFNTALALVQFFARQEAVSAIVFWTMGSLGKATWEKVAITAVALVVIIPFLLRQRWKLTALRLGEAQAAAFGVKVGKLRLQIMLLVALLTAIPVAFVGTIGFVGLVGPHIARIMVGEDQRVLLPASALIGALIMVCGSILAKIIMPGTILPIGIVTSAIGLPVFLYYILRSKTQLW